MMREPKIIIARPKLSCHHIRLIAFGAGGFISDVSSWRMIISNIRHESIRRWPAISASGNLAVGAHASGLGKPT